MGYLPTVQSIVKDLKRYMERHDQARVNVSEGTLNDILLAHDQEKERVWRAALRLALVRILPENRVLMLEPKAVERVLVDMIHGGEWKGVE